MTLTTIVNGTNRTFEIECEAFSALPADQKAAIDDAVLRAATTGFQFRYQQAFADARATRYRPGDFLTKHDDDVVGKDRHVAYMSGVTPNWRPRRGACFFSTHPAAR